MAVYSATFISSMRRLMKFDIDLIRFFINLTLILVQAVLVSLSWNILLVSVAVIAIYIAVNLNNLKLITGKLIGFVRKKNIK